MIQLKPTNLYAVPVEANATNLSTDNHPGLLTWDDPPFARSIDLPDENYRLVGLVTKDAVQSFTEKQGNSTFDAIIYALLLANEVWFENPLGERPVRVVPFKHAGYYTDRDKDQIKRFQQEEEAWQAAQARTSPAWAIIEKL